MQTDRVACFALATRYPNHTFVGGYEGNQQPRCLVVHCPIVVGTIDLVCGNTAIDLNLTGVIYRTDSDASVFAAASGSHTQCSGDRNPP